MPTIFTHGAIGFTASKLALGPPIDRRLLLASILLPILPDADALLTPWIPYRNPFGHRGITHSLLFAALVGIGVAYLAVRQKWSPDHSFLRLAIFFAMITASHGLFDAMTIRWEFALFWLFAFAAALRSLGRAARIIAVILSAAGLVAWMRALAL